MGLNHPETISLLPISRALKSKLVPGARKVGDLYSRLLSLLLFHFPSTCFPRSSLSSYQ